MKPLEGACPGWYRAAEGQGWTSNPDLAAQVPDDYVWDPRKAQVDEVVDVEDGRSMV